MHPTDQETKTPTPATEPQSWLRLEPLFRAELRYTSESPTDAVIPPEGREGVYIGSGDGSVNGRLQGTIRWSFYAADCMYLLVRRGDPVPQGQHLCYDNPGGFIETRDGASIRFDAKGYGLRGFDPAHPHLWRLVMGLQFHTEDPRYRWLNSRLGMWEGQFDEQTASASYQAYLQGTEN
jgi:Protein of unknown function (DUF3237)